MQDFAFDPADLAPGDAKSAAFPIADLDVRRVHSTIDPLFQPTYDQLWAQFGSAHEIESVDVLERRLAWPPDRDAAGLALRYDLLLIRKGDEFVATRDHTAVADGES